MSERNVLGLIPARGGSKGVERKNVRELAGRPLIAHTIAAALDAEAVTETVVTTDDDEIAAVAVDNGAKVPFKRPAKLAADETPTEPVIVHAIKELDKQGESYDDLILLQPTSPLRTAADIDAAYDRYRTDGTDSVISARPTKDIQWEKTPQGAQRKADGEKIARRQDRSPDYVVNGAMYITGVNQFMETESLTAGRTEIYEMDAITSVDIDTPFDLWLAERILEGWYEN